MTIGDPSKDPNATVDPYKTLFVGRLVKLVVKCSKGVLD
jgi:hypothetical protein